MNDLSIILGFALFISVAINIIFHFLIKDYKEVTDNALEIMNETIKLNDDMFKTIMEIKEEK